MIAALQQVGACDHEETSTVMSLLHERVNLKAGVQHKLHSLTRSPNLAPPDPHIQLEEAMTSPPNPELALIAEALVVGHRYVQKLPQ